MGQKVNPTGFRTGIMIGWKSRWYASKREFADLLVEDQKIRAFVQKRKDKFGKPLYPAVAKVEIERTRDEVKVILFSARPGILIGRKGERVEELQKELLDAMFSVLSEQGQFITFAYLHGLPLKSAKRFRSILEERFEFVSISPIVWRNFPPAIFYSCRR